MKTRMRRTRMKRKKMMRMGTPLRMAGTPQSPAARTRARTGMRWGGRAWWGGRVRPCQDGHPGDGMFLAPRMRRMMRMKMMMRMMTRTKTTSLRVAAPALPPQGTLRTLTPTEAQPHLGLPSPTDRLCFPPLFCPLPLASPTFFLSFFFKQNMVGGGAGGAQARTLQPQRHQPWGLSREGNHQTEPPLDWTVPPLFCTCGSGMDNGPGSGVGGGPKEFSEDLYTCSPT